MLSSTLWILRRFQRVCWVKWFAADCGLHNLFDLLIFLLNDLFNDRKRLNITFEFQNRASLESCLILRDAITGSVVFLLISLQQSSRRRIFLFLIVCGWAIVYLKILSGSFAVLYTANVMISIWSKFALRCWLIKSGLRNIRAFPNY